MTNDEIPELKNLPREIAPPVELEDRIAATLRERGLLARSHAGLWIAAAAAIVMFLAGLSAGLSYEKPHATFVLLLREGPQWNGGVAHERAPEYAAWARKVRASGTRIEGERLITGGAEITTDSESGYSPAN